MPAAGSCGGDFGGGRGRDSHINMRSLSLQLPAFSPSTDNTGCIIYTAQFFILSYAEILSQFIPFLTGPSACSEAVDQDSYLWRACGSSRPFPHPRDSLIGHHQPRLQALSSPAAPVSHWGATSCHHTSPAKAPSPPERGRMTGFYTEK